MPRITITTDEGTVIEVLTTDNIGNLETSAGRAQLVLDVKDAVQRARRAEAEGE